MTNLAYREIVIVDAGLGNMFSVQHACLSVGINPLITSNKRDVEMAAAVILPGVGAFGEAMRNLRALDLISPLLDFIASGRPFMGICLGMQLLFSESDEFGNHRGLGIVEGDVTRFPDSLRVPQIGWNVLEQPANLAVDWEATPLSGITQGEYMYFVHSYYVRPAAADSILSVTDYEGTKYCSTLLRGNVFATQYHPEKSAAQGIHIYRNWAKQMRSKADERE